MKNLIKTIFIFCFSFSLMNCSDQLDSSNKLASIIPYLTDEDFIGVENVINLTTGLKISWSPANADKDITGYNVYRYLVNKPVLIATVAPNVTSYIDSDVESGTKYTYMVRVLDPSEKEDTNKKTKSALFWEGLTSVNSESQSSIRVQFSNQLKGYLIKIYLKGEGKEIDRSIATLRTDEELSKGYYDIVKWSDNTSLKPGAEYKVYAQLFEVNNSSVTDGNNVEYTVQTKSYGFHSYGSQAQGWNNIATLRAFGEAPLTQLVPTNITTLTSFRNFANPQNALVEIGFMPFNLPQGLASNTYKYKVIRAPETTIFDSSQALPDCPTTYNETTSLVPCIVQDDIDPTNDLENGLIVIRDQSVWKSTAAGLSTIDTTLKPPRYRYFLTLQHLNTPGNLSAGTYTEMVPKDEFKKFSVLVPIPPAYMTLVNREAVNFEFCKIQMSKPTDPLNNNRCEHSEVGASTFNAGPGQSSLDLSEDYYDFGYNLFVDRYPLSCNNTHHGARNYTTNIAGANVRDSIPTTIYDNSGSVTSSFNENDVLFTQINSSHGSSNLNNGGLTNCLIRYNSNWYAIDQIKTVITNTMSLQTAYTAALTSYPRTGVPGTPKFNAPVWDQETASLACGSMSGSGYGMKRIPRMREFRAFSAPPFEVTIDSKNIKDFYSQEINSATPLVTNTATSWTKGYCTYTNRTTNNFNSTITSALTELTTPANFMSSLNAQKFGVMSNTDASTINFMLGSENDSLCMSKYGINEVVGTPSTATYNVSANIFTGKYILSDLMSWTYYGSPTFGALLGLTNSIDQGNNDLIKNLSKASTGYFISLPTATGASLTTSSFSSTVRFNQALGLPAISTETLTLSNYQSQLQSTKNYQQVTLLRSPANTGSTSLPFAPIGSARYSTTFDNAANRARCVLTAE